MRLKFPFINFLLLILFLTNLYSSNKLTKVSIQLEWKHQFEFAGFYAAIEKGYYKDIGLDLEIKEFKDGINISDDVLSGRSTFGISSSALILEKLHNKPVVLLSSYFKQNALAFVAQKDIKTVKQLKGKKIMAVDREIGYTSLGLMLKDNNIKSDDFTRIEHNFKVDKFINGEVDAMSIFLTSQLYELNRAGVEYTILNPSNYGIYSYDVELFTSEDFIVKNPKLVKSFVDATNKGWRYAFENKSEIIDLIYTKYTKRKTKESLRFEANETEKFFKTNIFAIGSVISELIKLNTDMYVQLDLANPNYNVEKLFNEYIYNYKNYTNKYIDFTQEELEYIKKNPIVTIAMLNNFEPFSFLQDDIHQGLSDDILQEISQISGLRFKKEIDTWSPILKKFKNKEVDMISGISHTKNRESFTLFTKPYFEIPTYLFGLKKDNSYVNIESLKGKKVAISQSIFYKKDLEELGIDVIELIGSDQKVDALVFNQIDYFLASYTSGQKAINSKGITTIKPIVEFTSIKQEDLRFGVNKEKKILYSIIKKSMDKIEEIQYAKFINKWMMNLDKKDRVNRERIYLTKEEKEYLKKKKEIKFCTDPYWMPFEQIKDGIHEGMASDYVKLFEERVGVPFNLVPTTSWSQSVEYAKKKECDILSFLAMETKSRKEYSNFTTSYMETPLVIATKPEVPFVTNLSDLDKKKIGISRNYPFYEIIKEKYPQINLVQTETIEDGLTKVKNGQLFGYIGTLPSIGYMFQTKFTGELKITGRFDENLELSIASRDDEPILFNILQKTLDSIDQETHKNIFNKWIAIKYESKVDYELLWKIIIIAMIIFLIFIYWNRKLRILNSELEFQKNKAQEALKIKSNFLANITHEIRTPMNVIFGMTYLVQKSSKDKQQQEQRKNIEKASSSLLRLINDILDSSKIEVGKLNIVKNNFNMIHILENIRAVATSNIKEKDIKFEIEYDLKLPINFYGDSLRIEQVLTNLVSNATKFTQTGFVRLAIENTKYNKYRFCVSDSGIGVSKEQINNIFDPFTQADDTITRKYGGTGLGLSISKQLVELMGGELTIKSKLGEGTEIYFDIELMELGQKTINYKNSIIKKNYRSFTFNKDKETISKEEEKELIIELQEAIRRKRPKLLQPILENLDRYSLQILEPNDYNEIKFYIKKYMFTEASEILDKYEK